MALINLQNISIHFGGPLLLDNADLQIHRGERVCLLGRNGTGKTTLMKLINNTLQPDSGTISRQKGLTTAILTQEVPADINGDVFDVVMSGLGPKGELPKQYHHLSVRLSEEHNESLLKQLDLVQKKLEAEDGWELHRQAETVITQLKLDENARFENLSAGLKRRVLLGRAMVGKPDILLLDEPTNHLDIDAITHLEEFLLRFEGTLLFVTHDRVLVKNLATRIIELDRGKLFNWDCNYEDYLKRKENALESEKVQWNVFDKKLAQEEVWIRQGIKARRTRNEGRVKALLKMREERRTRREQMGLAKMNIQETKRSGKLVIEAENLSFKYEDKNNSNESTTENNIFKDFSTLILRGDRIGIIGPNGSGKTTLLRVLLGQLTPQQGSVRLGTNLEIVYFDQLRNRLDDEKSVRDNVADGNDRILLNGKTRHIIGYLQDFLFTPERARTPVKVLSGGERNRLLLAKLFATPSNLLVMDEPTNDLDVETLELLEEILTDYSGTLLLVSHDRAFLNNVVTGTMVLEGDAKINEYIGGYDDWLLQRSQTQPANNTGTPDNKKNQKASSSKPTKNATDISGGRSRKLTYKEQQELEQLPQKIEEMEEEQETLFQAIASPDFYKQDGTIITETNQRLEILKNDLAHAYKRWEELEQIEAARKS